MARACVACGHKTPRQDAQEKQESAYKSPTCDPKHSTDPGSARRAPKLHELALRLLSGLGRTQWQVHSPPARQLGGVDLLLVAAPATARDAFQVRKRPGQGRRHVTNSSTGRCASRAYQKKFRLAALGVRFADCGWLSIAPVLQPKDMPASSKRLRAMQEAGRPVVSTLPSRGKVRFPAGRCSSVFHKP